MSSKRLPSDALSQRLLGMTVLVIGAKSGIGRATALLAAREGASVLAADLVPEVERTAAAIREAGQTCTAMVADVSRDDDCATMVELAQQTYGRLNAVVHSAAVSASGTVTTMRKEDWDRVLAVDLTSAFFLGRAAVPALTAAGGGSIVFIASQLGLVGAQNSVAYTAAKAGLINLARSMALDHAAARIRVNCVCPGPVETEFLQRSFDRQVDPEAARERLLARVPLGRFGTADEIAHGVVFLISPESSFVTGTAMTIDGGVLAQ